MQYDIPMADSVNKYDILVAGGGPAGCALAIAVRRLNPALRVLILERSAYEKQRVGETLPPPCRVLLERLGIWEDFLKENHLPAFGAISAWGSEAAASQEFMTTVLRNGWHLDRSRFDAFIGRMAQEAGAELRMNTAIQNFDRSSHAWQISYGKGEQVEARILVDATGRKATVARQMGAEVLKFDRLVGSMALLDAETILDRDTLVEARPEGWWYSALLPGQKMAVAFFTDAHFANKLHTNQRDGWMSLLRAAPLTSARIEPLARNQTFSLKNWPAHSQRLKRPIGEYWLAIGDASAAFDPLSSQGIFYALRSGFLGAFAASDLLAGGKKANEAQLKYAGMQLAEFNDYWKIRRDFYLQEQRWPQQHFWRTRHQPISIGPEDKLLIKPLAGIKPRFFSLGDLNNLTQLFPDGALAREWMTALNTSRKDLPAALALEGLQCLVEDGHALIMSKTMLTR